tara:strand:- start:6035 stop:7093 length:1059 start_codon:yes stop_codon:yes gene_type:complete
MPSVKNKNKKTKMSGLLFHGDNVKAMKDLIDKYELKGSVDLVYIDPPFATNIDFRISDDRASTISNSNSGRIAYSDKLTGKDYLEFIRERLLLLKELMSDKASIYVHIDYKVGHYMKVLMDEVFGEENFKADIARIKCNPKNFQRKNYGNIKDLILFYTKGKNYIWNEPVEERSQDELNRLFNKIDSDGRRYTTNPLHAPGETKNGATGSKWKGMLPPKGRHWRYAPEVLDKLEADGLIEWSMNRVPRKKIFVEDYKTKKVQDIWEYKDSQKPIYPTEKNLDLLKRIMETSSNKDSLVLDCFCGSGGTLYISEKLDRRWIGIDESNEAIKVTRKRFKDSKNLFSEGIKVIKI